MPPPPTPASSSCPSRPGPPAPPPAPGQRLGVDQQSLTASPEVIRHLPDPVQHAVVEALARSIHVTFLWALPLLVVAFFVTFLLRETPLRETAHLTVPLDALGVAAESEAGAAGPVLIAPIRQH